MQALGKDSTGQVGITYANQKSKGGMGFRKLRDFNLALLGKQAWHLLNNDDSLVTKVFKAWYFPRSSVLDAKLG